MLYDWIKKLNQYWERDHNRPHAIKLCKSKHEFKNVFLLRQVIRKLLNLTRNGKVARNLFEINSAKKLNSWMMYVPL